MRTLILFNQIHFTGSKITVKSEKIIRIKKVSVLYILQDVIYSGYVKLIFFFFFFFFLLDWKYSKNVKYYYNLKELFFVIIVKCNLCNHCIHDTNRCKAENISFYIIFRSRLLVVTMAEMYSKNHAVSYKLHAINGRWTLLTAMIIYVIKQNLVVLYVVPGLAASLHELTNLRK